LAFRLQRIEPIRVSVRRGGLTEAVHRVHAVAVQDGAVIAAAGNAGLVAFMRSSSKPLQAIPLARARADLDERDLAIASASHLADDAQLAAVRALLAKAPASEDELECGPEGEPPSRLRHNCSGKHAGMLALCRAKGWRSEGYRLEGHRVQREMLAVHAESAEVPEDEIRTGIDGCGVLTFALTLERMAHAFARLPQLEGGAAIAAGMRAYPELIRGPRAADTRLMQTLPGWIAKGGAEGLLCASRDSVGVALKVEDGNGRAIGPAAAAFFRHLELDLGDLAIVSLENSRGELVGDITILEAGRASPAGPSKRTLGVRPR
jgi:L-asparaginase II